LGIGQLRYDQDGATRRVYIDGGFAQVFEDKVTVLTPNAIPVEDITPAVVQAAEQKLAGLKGDERSQQQRRLSVLQALRPPRV
jgi:F0F1-type ATP synthase epsilon subunit